LGTDPLGKLLIRLSWPSIISMVAVSLYNLVNTFWVAKLGYPAVAAITVVMPFFFFTMAVGVGTGIGMNALSSRKFGERDASAPNRVTGQGFFLSIGLGLLFALITNLFPRQILKLCGATPEILDMGESYIRILGLGMPTFLFSLISRNVFHAAGDTMRPMIFTVGSQVLNCIIDPFLIFGIWFFPQLGVTGAAVASVTASLLGSLYSLWYILSGRTSYRIVWRDCLPDFKIIREIYRVGMPAIFMEGTESVVFALFNNVAAGFGTVALAALGIGMRIADLAFMPIIGVAHGLMPIVGFSLGAKLWQRLWGAVRRAAVWLALLMLGATILLEIFIPQVVRLFNSDPELIAIAVPGLRIFCISLVLVGPTIICITTFQGLSRGTTAWLLSLARQMFFFIPLLYILSYFLGIEGVWLTMPISDTLGAAVAIGWLYREYRMQKKERPLDAQS
jgi:putative MATE family efflux protein